MDHGDKLLRHPPDFRTTVVVTRSIPVGTSFGPCALQNTFYDTIAFIAQKSSDKKEKSSVFRVDPEAMHNSALALSWLRLIQTARNADEKNTEAFLKAGQVHVRTTRDIQPEEELLVWYDQELSCLLGFTDMTRGSCEEFKCGRCSQVFKNEYPYLAHGRFLCSRARSAISVRCMNEHGKLLEIKKQHRVTDFHNIARDLEHKRSGSSEEVEFFPKKTKCEDTSHSKWRKTVLSEKTNISNDNNISQLVKECEQIAGEATISEDKGKSEAVKEEEATRSSGSPAEGMTGTGIFAHQRDFGAKQDKAGVFGARSSSTKSAFSLVLSNSHSAQKSAFCKPGSRNVSTDAQAHHARAHPALTQRPEELTDVFTCRTVLGYNNLVASSLLSGDLQTVASPVAFSRAFHYAPEHWCQNLGAQLHAAPSLAVLPPTLTSFGVSAQNWCAKCNLSFRMTSDLVFHMRSHHKKEFAAEAQMRRRREEKLTCPICHEYFRERHHLSRHMTSHN